MKAAELRSLRYRELQERLDETKEEYFNLRFQLATNQLDNTARLGDLRRDIARINTVMRQQEIEAYYEEAGAEGADE